MEEYTKFSLCKESGINCNTVTANYIFNLTKAIKYLLFYLSCLVPSNNFSSNSADSGILIIGWKKINKTTLCGKVFWFSSSNVSTLYLKLQCNNISYKGTTKTYSKRPNCYERIKLFHWYYAMVLQTHYFVFSKRLLVKWIIKLGKIISQ